MHNDEQLDSVIARRRSAIDPGHPRAADRRSGAAVFSAQNQNPNPLIENGGLTPESLQLGRQLAAAALKRIRDERPEPIEADPSRIAAVIGFLQENPTTWCPYLTEETESDCGYRGAGLACRRHCNRGWTSRLSSSELECPVC